MMVSMVPTDDFPMPCSGCGQPAKAIEINANAKPGHAWFLCLDCSLSLGRSLQNALVVLTRPNRSSSFKQCGHLGCRNVALTDGFCGAHLKDARRKR